MEEGENGGMKLAAVVGRPVDPDDQTKCFCGFLERRKRKGFENFVVETRVDEWCYSLPKVEVKMNIYGGTETGLEGGWVGNDLMANN